MAIVGSFISIILDIISAPTQSNNKISGDAVLKKLISLFCKHWWTKTGVDSQDHGIHNNLDGCLQSQNFQCVKCLKRKKFVFFISCEKIND